MQLKRNLGLKEATSLGIGAMVGAGIFVLSGVASGLAGPAVILSFIFAALLEGLLGLCYAELASRFPKAGGSYTFVYEIMGPFFGTVTGWCYWGAWLTASSFVSQGFGNYLHDLIGTPPLLSAILLLLGLGILNTLGVKLSGFVQLLVVLADIILILSFVLLGWSHVNTQLYIPFAPKGIAGITSATLVGFLSMVGWDGIVAAGEEVKNPAKNIRLAIFLAIAIVLILYSGLLVVALGVVPWQVLGSSPVPVSLASQHFMGKTGPIFINVVIVVALVATCNAFIFSISRTAFAMGRNHLFPSSTAFIHSRLGTPIGAVALGTGLQVAITACSSINIAVSATSFLYLLTFIFTISSLLFMRKRNKQFSLSHTIIPVIALGVCLVLLFSVGVSGILSGSVWILTGIVLYFIRRKKLKANTENEPDISPVSHS